MILRIPLFFTLMSLSKWSVKGDCVWNGERAINCDLRILDFRRNSSDVPQEASKVIETLNVDCSDVLFFESQLRSDHFGDLSRLSTLRIHNCKIRTLPPRSFVSLGRLRVLEIRTHNADWSSLRMEPDYESLIGLDALEILDFSYNNVKRFSQGLLCPLKSIKLFNASDNDLTDLEDLGLRNSSSLCQALPTLKTLILKNNAVGTVTPGALSSLVSLTSLDLSRNDLRVLVNDAFNGFKELRHLDLSHNFLVALPAGLFNDTSKLESLSIGNNSLGSLDLFLFNNLPRLKTLNLSGNSLDENWIKPGVFEGLAKLVLLDLSYNHITSLEEPELFAPLGNLEALNLDSNRLQSLSKRCFRYTPKLVVLTLSRNQLEAIQQETLNGLSVLETLFLDNNKIHSLHSGIFDNSTKLQKLKLNNNYHTQVPTAVNGMKSLTYLDLSSNLIGTLKKESLKDLPSLITLRIASNELSRIGNGTFSETPQLKHLDLSDNRFKSFEGETFKSLEHLQSLNIADNSLEDVNGVLSSQINLRWLNISNNNLGWFDYAFLPLNCEWLDIRNNRLDSLGNYYALKEDYSLQYLDASFNKIRVLKPLSVIPSLTHLYLNDNDIDTIEADTFLGKRNLTTVHLERNNLSRLEMSSLIISSTDKYSESPSFYFEENPFICDCHLQWFQGINTRVHRYPHVEDIDRISCSSRRNSLYAVLLPIAEVPPEGFLCRYESHCFPSCMCCDFFACDCRLKCPEEDGCFCFRDSTWSSNVVRCSSKDLKSIPSSIPVDATSMHLDGNNFTEIHGSMFLGRTKLSKLFLNNSRISSISNDSFTGLPRLRTLDLSQNQLQRLEGPEFTGLESSLRELYLQGNQLVRMSPTTFKELKELRTLRLDGNLLISFPAWMLAFNPNLLSLSLAHNWWQCECEFVRKFRQFIDERLDVIADYKSITCTSRDGRSRPCSNEFFTSEGRNLSGNEGASSEMWMIILGSCVFFTAIIAISIFAFRENFKVWLHSKHDIRLKFGRNFESSQSPVFFDVLFIYDQKHASLVTEELGKKGLGPSYKCVYHQRDLSGNYHSEGFKSAVSASSDKIIVMSSYFIEFEWDAFRSFFDEKRLFDGANKKERLIAILLEDEKDIIQSTSSERQRNEIRSFWKRDCKKVLKYKKTRNTKFWEELRFYLKDPMLPSSREGGAELDRSGIWSFSSFDEEDPLDSSTTPMLANLLMHSSRTPQLKKQCSANAPHRHSISQLHPSLTTSGLIAAPPERVAQHQRSVSAITGRRVQNHSIDVSSNPRHARSRSAVVPTQTRETSFTTTSNRRERIVHDRSVSTIVESQYLTHRTHQYHYPEKRRNSACIDFSSGPGTHYRSTSTPFSNSAGFVL